jgi:hypothetical protein
MTRQGFDDPHGGPSATHRGTPVSRMGRCPLNALQLRDDRKSRREMASRRDRGPAIAAPVGEPRVHCRVVGHCKHLLDRSGSRLSTRGSTGPTCAVSWPNARLGSAGSSRGGPRLGRKPFLQGRQGG